MVETTPEIAPFNIENIYNIYISKFNIIKIYYIYFFFN